MEKYEHPRLTKITLAGYKSISFNFSQDILIGDINILIGANGSGKSNLVSFFKMINYMLTGALQNYIGINGSSENILHFGSKKTPKMQAVLEFNDRKGIKTIYNISFVKTVQDSLIFSEESITYDGYTISLNEGHKESFLLTNVIRQQKEQMVGRLLSKCRIFQFHDTSMSANFRANCPIDNNRYLFSDGGNIASILYLLKNKKDYVNFYERIVFFVQMIFPQFEDFIIEPLPLNSNYVKLNWKHKNIQDYILGVDQLSDGTIRFIALATLILEPPDLLPNIIVIDEPELGLHPQAIDALASMMAIASRYSQIIIATHSERLLDNFSAEDIIVAEHDRVHNCSLYKRLNSDELHDWLIDYSLSQLWEKNLIGGQP